MISGGQEGIWGVEGYTLYFNYNDEHITVYLSNFRSGHLKKGLPLMYVNYTKKLDVKKRGPLKL